MNIKYPLAKETINNQDIDALIEWLKTYPRLTKGNLTPIFEEKLSAYLGIKHSVFVNSGSSANLLMMYLLSLIKSSHANVLVPAVGWATTITPIIQIGMNPIMVDVDANTFGIDLNRVEDECKKQRIDAVVFVQVLGIPHYKNELLELKNKYGFLLLEDACAALGSKYEDGTKVGTIGDMSSISFYAGHFSSTIEGGTIHTNSKLFYDKLIMLRSHGWGKDLDEQTYNFLCETNYIDSFHKPFTFFIPGFNVRSTDLQAFIGIRQIDRMDYNATRRNENHIQYSRNLNQHLRFQKWKNDYPVSISFGVLAESNEQRKKIVTALDNNGIETRLFSAGNLGLHPFWIDRYGAFHGKVADVIHNTGFFLPNYPELTLDNVNEISDIVIKNK